MCKHNWQAIERNRDYIINNEGDFPIRVWKDTHTVTCVCLKCKKLKNVVCK